jgi:hypothetical protein
MADIASAATAARCQLNASLSASIVNDRSELMQFYKNWSEKYDEVNNIISFCFISHTFIHF